MKKQRVEKYSERFNNNESEIGNPDTWGKRVVEEPKQENCCTPVGQIKRYIDCIGCDCKPKQETLEEASWKHNPLKKLDGEFLRHAFKEGAKWQAERMYSEEDMINFAKYILSKEVTIARSPSDVSSYLPKEFKLLLGELEHNGKELLKKWFEQFKNK